MNLLSIRPQCFRPWYPMVRVVLTAPYLNFVVILCFCILYTNNALAREFIPFVGCSGYIQGVLWDAPLGKPVAVKFDTRVADRLALYVGYGQSILAPRGWKCGFMAGTAEGGLSIVPESGRVPRGSVIGVWDFPGDSNAALVSDAFAARYFPRRIQKLGPRAQTRQQYRDILKWYLNFPNHTADVIRYKSDHQLEFVTPPHSRGLGTVVSRGVFINSPFPTYGVLKLVWDDGASGLIAGGRADLYYVRLPPNLGFLRPAILKALEDGRFCKEFCG